MNTTKVAQASQDETTEQFENTTVHFTEEERAGRNPVSAIPEASSVYAGDNTHAGAGTFSGPVVLDGTLTPDALETERMLAKVTACSCIPLISAFNATVK